MISVATPTTAFDLPSTDLCEPLLTKANPSSDKVQFIVIEDDDASTCTASTTLSTSSTNTAEEPSVCSTSVTQEGEQEDERELEATAYWNLTGNAHYLRGECNLAETCYLKAIENSKVLQQQLDIEEPAQPDALPHLASLADAYSNLAVVHWETDVVRALNLLRYSLRIHHQYRAIACHVVPKESSSDHDAHCQEKLAMAAVLMQLGLGWMSRGLYDQAHSALHDSWDLRLDVWGGEPHKSIAIVLSALGDLAMAQYNFEDAINYYEHAFSIRGCLNEESGTSNGLAESLEKLSLAYRAVGEGDAALFGYQAVLNMQQEQLLTIECGSKKKSMLRESIGSTLATIGDLLFEGERFQEATEAFQRAKYFSIAAKRT